MQEILETKKKIDQFKKRHQRKFLTQSLKKQIVALMRQHPIRPLARNLGISSSSLYQWRKQLEITQIKSEGKKPIEFYKFPTGMNTPDERIELELIGSKGQKAFLRISPNHQEVLTSLFNSLFDI